MHTIIAGPALLPAGAQGLNIASFPPKNLYKNLYITLSSAPVSPATRTDLTTLAYHTNNAPPPSSSVPDLAATIMTLYHSLLNRRKRTTHPSNSTMAFTPTRQALYASLALLMICAAIEMAFISSTVYWLHYRAGKAFEIAYNGSTFSLHGKPVGLLADQGHTSNGAAGTAFVLVGLGGILALWLRSRNPSSKIVRGYFTFWVVLTVLSKLLSLGALVYTFILTHRYSGQTLDIPLASTLHNRPYPNYVAYPLDFWTPENWLSAILHQLTFVRESDRKDVATHLRIQEGWRWNLVPLFLLSLVVCGLAVVEWWAQRGLRRREKRGLEGYEGEGKRVSAGSSVA